MTVRGVGGQSQQSVGEGGVTAWAVCQGQTTVHALTHICGQFRAAVHVTLPGLRWRDVENRWRRRVKVGLREYLVKVTRIVLFSHQLLGDSSE